MATSITILEDQIVGSTGSTQLSLVAGLRVLLLDEGTDYFLYTLLQNIDQSRVNGGSLFESGGTGTDSDLQIAARDLILGTSSPPATYDGTMLEIGLNRAREEADDTGIDLTTGDDVAFKYPDIDYLSILKNDAPELVGAYMSLSEGGKVNISLANYNLLLVGSSSFIIRQLIDDLSDTPMFQETEISFLLFASYDVYSAAIELIEQKIRFLNSSEEISGTASKIKVGEIEIDKSGSYESKTIKIQRFKEMQTSIRELQAENLAYNPFVFRYPGEARDVITSVYSGPNQDAELTGNINITIGGSTVPNQ